MHAEELILELLDLEPPWSVGAIEVDAPSHRLDITLDFGVKKKGFLGRRNKASYRHITLRHLPIFGLRTFLRVPDLDEDDTGKVWVTDGKITQEMEQFAIKALQNCRSNQATSRITGLTATETRMINERTGTQLQDEDVPVAAQTQAQDSDRTLLRASRVQQPVTDEHSYEILHETQNILKETHPNWQKLIDGEIALSSNVVGLQMLLQQIRQNIASKPGETTRLAGIRLLRQYFVKNQKLHETDIAQFLSHGNVSPIADTTLTKSRQQPSPPKSVVTQAAAIPDEHHPQWKRIIDGNIRLQTNNIGLQMMLERVRQSVERNPSESGYFAGIKILRQFFKKHAERLQQELEQLSFVRPQQSATLPAASDSSVDVPTETDSIWQKMIDNAVSLSTGVVGLQMMLQQVRQSVARNPSEKSRLAGVKILRQFFLKHQSQLTNELRQLYESGAHVKTLEISQSFTLKVPVESDPVWLRLINGAVEIKTDAVALKMMLERVRLSIQNNPSDITRMAGIKILRRYFIKHQQIHRSELGQLMAT